MLLVRMHIIYKFVLLTLPPKTDMPLERMWVAILWTICGLSCYNQYATPEVAICTANVVIPAHGAGIVSTGEWL
jgi:hypothetical protein